MLKDKLPIFLINTLLLYIPLLTLTDGQNYRQRNELILVGLGNLRFLQVKRQTLNLMYYFFKVERVKKHEFKKKLTSKQYLVETILEST